jgi:hypothetical protein
MQRLFREQKIHVETYGRFGYERLAAREIVHGILREARRRVRLDISLTGGTEVAKDEVQVLFGCEGCRAHDAELLPLRKSGPNLF